ncbi:hypothetical protein AX15_001585 [Amanita polypyramis BW_CC]|nr:hypothetical protein AX15_001585 [Amanita polypyramis BW_CC]
MTRAVQPPINIELPVGSRLGWELENTVESKLLHSVADSAVLVRSLRQSRERWLLSNFPKFSTKARPSKSSEAPPPPPPPPHTTQIRGRCDVEIGPHIFSDTVFYEIHYLPTQLSSFNTYPYQNSWRTITPYSGSYGQGTPTPSTATQQSVPSSTSSIDSAALASVSPALINQVNSAASSNPILANLLQLAAAGKATQEQLKTLGLLIQSLASRDSAANVANQQQPSTSLPSSLLVNQPPVKPFDVVLEFRELPNERYLFPRGPTVCERVLDSVVTDAAYDAIITTCMPFKKASEEAPETSEQGASETPKQPEKTPQIVKIHLKKAPFTVWDTLYRWVGGEQEMNRHKEHLRNLKGAKRTYLGYQLLDGSLLTQLQAVSKNVYPMKYIKPGQHSSRSSKKRSAPRKESESSPKRGDGAPSAKQRRRTQSTKRAPVQILCQACGSTDVPLIHGGRYCRPCVDSGRAVLGEKQQSAPNATSQQTEPTRSPVFIHSTYSSQPQNSPAVRSTNHVT